MAKIAFLTSADYPHFAPDDKPALEYLTAEGFDVTPVIWDATPVKDLKQYDLVIVRSIWDYFKKTEKFKTWIAEVRDYKIKILNSSKIIHWNYTKKYLSELNSKNIPTIPTTWINPGEKNPVRVILECPWKKIVVKPEISGTANLTFLIERERAKDIEGHLIEIQKRGSVMVQPFCPRVKEGEYSLIYFCDGQAIEFSHAVLKVPRQDDFRVQTNFGGETKGISPSQNLKDVSEKALSTLAKKDWLYARVDLINYEGQPCIAELEMLEPQLFFYEDPGAARRFGQALKTHMQSL